ncbi:hypothetical protein [Gordonia sp. NPDC003422]
MAPRSPRPRSIGPRTPRTPGYRPRVAGSRSNVDDSNWSSGPAQPDPADQSGANVAADVAAPATGTDPEPDTTHIERADDPAISDDADTAETVPADEAETVETETDAAPSAEPDTDAGAAKADATEAVTLDKPTGKTRTVSRVSTLRSGADAPPTKSGPASDAKRPASARAKSGSAAVTGFGRQLATGRGWFSRRTVAILAAVAAVLAVLAAIAAAHPGADIGPNRAYIDTSATAELSGQVGAKICTAIAYQGPNVDEWVRQAHAVLSGEARKNFDSVVPTQRDLITKTNMVAECRVDSIGVKNLTEDGQGTVLASLIVSQSINGMAVNSGVPALEISAERSGDNWIINKILTLSTGG